MNLKSLTIAAAVALVLVGCGGGSGTGTPPPTGVNPPPPPPPPPPAPEIGVFVDAPVAGIGYRISGSTEVKFTNALGQFEYQPGDQVVFSIGGIELPPVAASDTVTPLTVFETSNLTDPQVVNLARLLQTLDSDPTDDVITIAEAAHQNAANLEVDFADTAAFETSVTNLIANGGGSTTLVSAEVAVQQMQEELVTRGLSPVGTWYVRGESNALITLTFMNDGRYLLVEDSVPEAGDTSGQPGVEYGTYEWNSATGVLTAQVAAGTETFLTDTNGEWGLSDPQGTMTMVISGDTAVIAESGGEPGDEGTLVHRVTADANKPLVGTWIVPTGTCGCGLALAIFIDDEAGRNYVQAEISESDEAGQSGYEVGSYEVNAEAGQVSVHVTSNTNGDWGLAGNDVDAVIPMVVEGDALNFNFEGEEPFSVPRLF